MHLARSVLTFVLSCGLFLPAGLALVRDLGDPAMRGPGIPHRALVLHRALTPRIERWARQRIASGRAEDAPLHDVPTTEWPMFTSVFYLLGTVELAHAWQRGEIDTDPMADSRGAVDAARDLVIDPSHHSWVRRHWGDDYLHRENVFFRALVISALTSHLELTGDRSDEPMLRDQVETLAAALDASPLGLLDDYPHECYPIDVLVAVAWIRHADTVLGTDHSAFAARALRAFTGAQSDELGLVRYRVDLTAGAERARPVQSARGIGMSWVLLFTPDLWPAQSADWYARYEQSFYRDHGWAAGFREYAHDAGAPLDFEIDAGAIVDGFGTAASAFGIAAARRNGRFDQAYALEAQMSATSFALADDTLLLPRLASHAADAPYLGEAALAYFLSVQPVENAPIVRPSASVPGLVWSIVVIDFGAPLAALASMLLLIRRSVRSGTRSSAALPLRPLASR
jgi:hypothetical protein